MDSIEIARVCHEMNRKVCQLSGDNSQYAWEGADEWQRESAIRGVKHRLAHPQASESEAHDTWMADKIADGWVYGPVKDADAKTHPCIVPYEELPPMQRLKDAVFCAVVDALK